MEPPKSLTYFHASRTGTYGFLAALPLFLLYEVLILFVNGNEISQIRVGADLWIKPAGTRSASAKKKTTRPKRLVATRPTTSAPEKKAKAMLRSAQLMLRHRQAARQNRATIEGQLKKVIATYPKTEAARKAQKLLDKGW